MSTSVSPTTVHVKLGSDRGYSLYFEPLARIADVMRAEGIEISRCLVVTDEHVADRFGQTIMGALGSAGFTPHLITLPPGETTKSTRHLGRIYDAALDWGIERGTPLLTLGGGVIGDLGGYAAATLLRGLPLIQIPTSLIAQVDSAIGGKTGINHSAGKNLIGAFHQPQLVLADPITLQTLPEREWMSGLSEVVKHGLIADEAFFSDLESSWDRLVRRDEEVVTRIVPAAARVKVNVVAQDERESGLREILNFGHTFAHAIERVAGYGAYTHGEAVAAGMRAALHLSKAVVPDLDADRADDLVRRIAVPGGLAALPVPSLMEAMKFDKKVRDGRIRFVLLDRIGHAYVTDDVPSDAVEAAWSHVRELVGS